MTMHTERNKEIVRQFFERFSAADVDGALSFLDEDVTWRAMGRDGGLPMSGIMDREGIGELIGNVKAAIPDGLCLTPTDWTCEGGRVALEMESSGKLTNGRVYNNFYHFLVEVTEGKITSLREYMDTFHAKQVFVDP